MGLLEDVKPSLSLFALYHRLHFIPLQLDITNGRLRGCISWSKKLKWKLMLCIGAIHVAFLNVRLIQAFLFSQPLNLLHFPLHFVNTFSQTIGLYVSYNLYEVCMDSNVKIFNHIMQPEAAGWRMKREYKKILREFDLQKIMVVTFPWLLVIAGAGVMLLIAIDPFRMQFSYLLLPEKWQNGFILAVLLALEFGLFNIEFAGLGFGVFLQLAYFQHCLQRLKKYSSETYDPWLTYKDLKQLHVLTIMFNDAQAGLILLIKIFCISASTVMLFFGVRHFHDNCFIAMFNLLIAAYGVTGFLALYDSAFAIPCIAKKVQRQALLGINVTKTREPKAVKRALISLPEFGIKVGNFDSLQRESTPIFLDYVASRASGLLVTFC